MNVTNRSDRFINIEGALNLRDFGGYATTDGRTVRRGKLFRCGAMNGIEDHNAFSDLDIGVICDLRRDEEVEISPTPTHEPYDVRVHIPIDPGSTLQLRESFGDPNMTHEDRIRFMVEITREVAREHVSAYTTVFSHLLDTERGFLIHCSAGKDRTGFGAAIIQLMLGVDRETVFHDYLVSNQATELFERMWPRIQAQGVSIDEASARVMAGVRREYLEGALEEVDTHFGGVDGYREAVGLTSNDLETLKARYLD